MAAAHPGMILLAGGRTTPQDRPSRADAALETHPMAHVKAAGNRGEQFLLENVPAFQDVSESTGRNLREVTSEQRNLGCLIAQVRVANSRNYEV